MFNKSLWYLNSHKSYKFFVTIFVVFSVLQLCQDRHVIALWGILELHYVIVVTLQNREQQCILIGSTIQVRWCFFFGVTSEMMLMHSNIACYCFSTMLLFLYNLIKTKQLNKLKELFINWKIQKNKK